MGRYPRGATETSGMTADLQHMLDVVCEAAFAAGEAILKIYAEEFEVRHKSDKTVVTEADLAAEKIIVDRLMAAFPDIPCVAEELCEAEGVPPCCDRFWAIDPLDGTREFIARNGEFAVLIALVEEGRPVLGVVHGPAVGITYTACGPGTATRRIGRGAVEPIHARTPPAAGLAIVHSRTNENSRRLGEFLRDFTVSARKSCGSALKFGVLAAGEGDLYPRFGTTMEWDTAAGQAILEAAGGRVETFAGATLAYGKPGFRNEGFLAWGAAPDDPDAFLAAARRAAAWTPT